MARSHRPTRSSHGQALVETALVLPLFLMVVFGIIVIGIGLFYQQQVTNAAREAARYAAVHSATSSCPTASWKTVNAGMVPDPAQLGVDSSCDPASAIPQQWPKMQAHGRELAGFGFDADALHFSACWSGYTDVAFEAASLPAWDAAPFAADGTPNRWDPCTIAGRDPLEEDPDNPPLPCPPPKTDPSDDTASNLAVSSGRTANQVTVYACYEWRPPLAGFLLIPETVTLRATISEALQHQR